MAGIREHSAVSANPPAAGAARTALVPAGSFQIGGSVGERMSDERPLHTIRVGAFVTNRYEIANALRDKTDAWATAHGYDAGPARGVGKAVDHPA